MIRVLYFARLREALGVAEESLEWTRELRTLTELRALLGQRHPALLEFQDGRRLLVALNQEMAHWEQPLMDGDEVALFPPVTGG